MKNIVFDMGNVIIEWNPQNLAKAINEAYSGLLVEKIFQSPTWAKLDEGLLTLEEGLAEILKQSPKEHHNILTYAFYNWGDYLVIHQNTEQLIKLLKDRGYGVYMLSNASVAFDTYHKKYPVFDLIEHKYISGHHRLVKPSKDIYLDFLTQYQLEAKECLFIDDVYENVEGAISVGMQGYHFKGTTKELEEQLL